MSKEEEEGRQLKKKNAVTSIFSVLLIFAQSYQKLYIYVRTFFLHK